MRTKIVQNNMQDLLTRITAADPLEERQEFYPGLVVSELAVEPVGLQIVDGQEMTHAALATVGGPQALHALTRPCQALAVARLQVQGSELVDAQPSAVAGPLAVQTANGPIFPPEKWIGRFFPGLGPTQPDLAAVQKLPEPFDADAGMDLLLDEIVPQLGQRPLIHADKGLGRRQSHFRDLLAEIGSKLPRRIADLPIGIPGDTVDAVGVETMNDGSGPNAASNRHARRWCDCANYRATARRCGHDGH